MPRARRGAATATATLAVALAIPVPARAQQPASPAAAAGPAIDSTERPLSLAAAVALAADTTPGVTLARLAAEGAAARVRTARADLLPALSGAVGWTRQTVLPAALGLTGPGFRSLLGPFGVADARASAAVPIVDPAGWARVAATRRGVDVAEADRRTAAATSIERVALAYLAGARAAATVTAREADLALARQSLDIAERQLRAGVSTALDRSRAATQVAEVREQLELAANARRQADVTLARALGVDPWRRFALAGVLLTPDGRADAGLGTSDAALAAAEAIAIAQTARAELRAASARLDAARASRRAIAADALPRLELVGNYGTIGQQVDRVRPTWAAGVQVAVPVFDGNRRRGREAEQDAVIAAETVRLADLRAQVVGDIESAMLDLRSAAARQAIARERLDLAGQEVEQARRRFEQGIAGNLDLNTAQTALVRARDAVIEAAANAVAARIRLARAEGLPETLR